MIARRVGSPLSVRWVWRTTALGLGLGVSAALLLVSSCGSPRVVDEAWPSGQAKRHGQLASGRQTGEWSYWYADGAKQARGGWQEDKQFGEWTWWFPNGQVQQTGSYAAGGKRTGHWRQFHQDGALASEGDYDRDRQDGLWTYRYADGKPYAEGTFDFGVKSGLWQIHAADGALKSRGVYFLGLKVGPWIEDGKTEAVVDLGVPKGFTASTLAVDGKTVGWAMSRASATSPAALASFPLRGIDGMTFLPGADGSWRFATALGGRGQVVGWYPDGTLALAGRSVDGGKEGHWRYWHDNGRLAVDALYHAAALQSWSTFKPDGSADQSALPGDPTAVVPAVAEGTESNPRQLIAALDRRFADLKLPPGAHAEGPLAAIVHEALDRTETTDELEKPADKSAPAGSAPIAVQPISGAMTPATGSTPAAPIADPAASSTAVASVAAPVATNAAQFENALPDPAAPALSPIQMLPSFWTKAEEGKAASFIERYSTGTASAEPDPYAVDNSVPSQRPDLIGKPLVQMRFLSADGTVIDLGAFAKAGKPVVVVVLRGFAGQVCLYCAAQTAALCNRIADFRKAGSEVVVIYPGPAEAAPAFIQAVQSLRKDPPPMPVVLDVSLLLVRALGIEDNLARPTSLVLDRAGKVRFAYVGKTIADRPSADDLLQEVGKLVK